ncbi:MAG: efflux RND transporter periplasmic adaptor subunit [Sphingomicrobium sp.]
MTPINLVPRTPIGRAIILVVLASGGIGYGIARWTAPSTAEVAGSASDGRKILYWYDPMVPQERYDNPDSLSSMGMKTQPKYAEDGATNGPPGVTVDPAARQSLGIRLVKVESGTIESDLVVSGTVDFNERNVAIIQARASGFVERVYNRAPGDVIRAGTPIADLLIPEWGGAQAEYRAVQQTGDRALIAASRQRLRLLGAPGVGGNGTTTIRSPIGGVIQTLNVRRGMTLSAGQTLAQVTGLGSVWVNAAVPEAQSAGIQVGRSARVELAAFPGESITGRIIAVLPTTQADSRTLTMRVELPNRGGRLRPGMFATVHLAGSLAGGLLVPSEAIIRTGKRNLVMVAGAGGRFRPVEVKLGREGGGKTQILAGLAPGQKVVASGQFLLDSEASLSGIEASPVSGGQPLTPPEQRH